MSDEKERPAKSILTIHEDRLEEDCKDLPQQSYVWGQKLALARKKADEAKNYLKLCYAQLSHSIRENPREYHVDKVTESSVDGAVLCHAQHQEAKDALVEAEYEQGVLEAFVRALQDKRAMIESMVKLHGQMYWSKPDVTPEVNQRKRK